METVRYELRAFLNVGMGSPWPGCPLLHLGSFPPFTVSILLRDNRLLCPPLSSVGGLCYSIQQRLRLKCGYLLILDVDIEMDQLLENIPVRLILEDEETPMLKMETLLDAVTEPPIEVRGGTMQAVAPQRKPNGEGGKEPRHNSWHPCGGLPSYFVRSLQPDVLLC